MLHIQGILETALYVANLDRSEEFYQGLFGFERVFGDERLRSLKIDDNHFLLLFLKGGSMIWQDTPGGHIPPHDGQGRLHMAFNVSEEDLPGWKSLLEEKGIEIISELSMNRGHSLYFHDPDDHVIELGTPGLWKR